MPSRWRCHARRRPDDVTGSSTLSRAPSTSEHRPREGAGRAPSRLGLVALLDPHPATKAVDRMLREAGIEVIRLPEGRSTRDLGPTLRASPETAYRLVASCSGVCDGASDFAGSAGPAWPTSGEHGECRSAHRAQMCASYRSVGPVGAASGTREHGIGARRVRVMRKCPASSNLRPAPLAAWRASRARTDHRSRLPTEQRGMPAEVAAIEHVTPGRR